MVGEALGGLERSQSGPSVSTPIRAMPFGTRSRMPAGASATPAGPPLSSLWAEVPGRIEPAGVR